MCFLYKILNVIHHRISKYGRLIGNTVYNRPIGNIYMFHMVRPKLDYIPAIDELRVSPEYFEKFLVEQREYVDFISIDEMSERIQTKRKGKKPFGVVTFDDGYDDNFIYAYPILKKLQVPFVIYVTVNFVNDGQNRIWNYPLIIERIIQKNDKLELGNGEIYSCATAEEKDEAFRRLRTIFFAMPYGQIQYEFEKFFGAYLTDDVFTKNTLTWEQIEKLAKDPLCTIGAHTMSHCRLIMDDDESLTYELKDCRDVLSQHLGCQINHMSYPFGSPSDVSDRAMVYARSIGYKTALMSGGGSVRRMDKDMYSLKRIQVYAPTA